MSILNIYSEEKLYVTSEAQLCPIQHSHITGEEQIDHNSWSSTQVKRHLLIRDAEPAEDRCKEKNSDVPAEKILYQAQQAHGL